MESIAINSVLKIAEEFGLWGTVLIVLLYAALLIYVAYRAESWFFVFDKIWLIIGGGGVFKSKDIETIWNDLREIEAFRFRTRLNISTIENIKDVDIYLKKYKMGFRDLIPFAIYFDTSKLALRKVNFRRLQIFFFLITIISYLLTTAPIILKTVVDFDYGKVAYLKFNDSKKVVYLYKNRAIIDGKRVGRVDCDDEVKVEKNTGATAIEVNAICGNIKSDNNEFHSKVVKEQSWLAGAWLVFFLIMMIFFARKSFAVTKAIEFEKMINQYHETNSKNEVL
jgi:hypothetical protein